MEIVAALIIACSNIMQNAENHREMPISNHKKQCIERVAKCYDKLHTGLVLPQSHIVLRECSKEVWWFYGMATRILACDWVSCCIFSTSVLFGINFR